MFMNKLLNVRQTLKQLGLKSNSRRWIEIKTVLIQQYGMTKVPGTGYLIPQKNLDLFIDEYFQVPK